MHKRICLTAVLLALCMLCGCSAAVYIRSPEEQQIQFYYCVESTDTGYRVRCLCRTNALTRFCSSI